MSLIQPLCIRQCANNALITLETVLLSSIMRVNWNIRCRINIYTAKLDGENQSPTINRQMMGCKCGLSNLAFTTTYRISYVYALGMYIHSQTQFVTCWHNLRCGSTKSITTDRTIAYLFRQKLKSFYCWKLV